MDSQSLYNADDFLVLTEMFCLIFFFFPSVFGPAASDHYLIGNNITVAVLGIVIPIGEYSWFSCCVVFAFVLLPPRRSVSASVLHGVFECAILCMYACILVIGGIL